MKDMGIYKYLKRLKIDLNNDLSMLVLLVSSSYFINELIDDNDR